MAAPSDLKRKALAQWWISQHTLATPLLAMAIDGWGTDCFDWEPETIRMQLRSDYGVVAMPQPNMDKLLALITALTTNLFYVSPEAFTNIANALNDEGADFRIWDPVEADEAAWAIAEVAYNDRPKKDEDFAERFSHEVRYYLGSILDLEGIVEPPGMLSMAERVPAAEKPELSFADDPSMYLGFYKLNQTKSEAISDYVKQRTVALMQQLNTVPLLNRDQERWTRFLSRAQRKIMPAAA